MARIEVRQPAVATDIVTVLWTGGGANVSPGRIVNRFLEGVGRGKLQSFSQTLLDGNPKAVVIGIGGAFVRDNVSQRLSWIDGAVHRKRSIWPDAVDELIYIDWQIQIGAFASDIGNGET